MIHSSSLALGSDGGVFFSIRTQKGRFPVGWEKPVYKKVLFSQSGMNEETLSFQNPAGVNQRVVFIGALAPFPVADICEVSNSAYVE